jgi:hypothetical protein
MFKMNQPKILMMSRIRAFSTGGIHVYIRDRKKILTRARGGLIRNMLIERQILHN